MKKYFLIIILITSSTLYGNLQLSNLVPGSQVEVSISSRGCFHGSSETLIIKAGENVTAELTSSEAIIELTKADVRNLDKNIKFHRDLEGYGGCTSVDEITYKWLSKDKVLHTEKYVDDTCSFKTNGMSFNSLVFYLLKLSPPNNALNQDVANATPIS